MSPDDFLVSSFGYYREIEGSLDLILKAVIHKTNVLKIFEWIIFANNYNPFCFSAKSFQRQDIHFI